MSLTNFVSTMRLRHTTVSTDSLTQTKARVLAQHFSWLVSNHRAVVLRLVIDGDTTACMCGRGSAPRNLTNYHEPPRLAQVNYYASKEG